MILHSKMAKSDSQWYPSLKPKYLINNVEDFVVIPVLKLIVHMPSHFYILSTINSINFNTYLMAKLSRVPLLIRHCYLAIEGSLKLYFRSQYNRMNFLCVYLPFNLSGMVFLTFHDLDIFNHIFFKM